ncbi:hypothetical protein MN608_06709 [Microdochium nivale]|nr:hypothetical protein MN608_06709 [Microdochium nivale]
MNTTTNSTSPWCPAAYTIPEFETLALPSAPQNIIVGHAGTNETAAQTAAFTTCCGGPGTAQPDGSGGAWPGCWMWCPVPQRFFENQPPSNRSAPMAAASAFDDCMNQTYSGPGEVGTVRMRWPNSGGARSFGLSGGSGGVVGFVKAVFAIWVAGRTFGLLG